MNSGQVITLFYVLLGSIGAFVVAIGVAMRKKWMSSREFLYVAPVLVIMTAISLGNFLFKVSPKTTPGLGEAALTDAVFTIAIAYALVVIWKKTKKDEQWAKDHPPKAKRPPSGPPVSASELRKRKKKRP